jgi:succinylglutamate desuccinylase
MITKDKTTVYSKPLKESIAIDRMMFKFEGNDSAPTMVFFGGIHGNETAGVFALREALGQIEQDKIAIHGSIYAIAGNLKALEKGQRFIDTDLNRMWTLHQINALKQKTTLNVEEQEQLEIYRLLEDILSSKEGPVYFIDLHTTSSKTLPFITINDAMINRKFSLMFPVPIVLGIEEYLEGPLLSYINELGYVSLGFESGQHYQKNAVLNSIAFINLALVFSRIVKQDDVPDYEKHKDYLTKQSKNISNIFEVIYLHNLEENESFEMQLGYKSFEPIKKGNVLALSNNKEIASKYNARIFMPLYQKKGKEGFFIIRKINPFFLKLSQVLRHCNAENFLTVFPGITWNDTNQNALKVNTVIAKYFAKPIFHLLGYRSKRVNQNYLILNNREKVSRTQIYKNEFWNK